MACNPITSAIGRDCNRSIGGVETVYITEFSNVTGITSTGVTVTAISMSGSSKFYEFKMERETANFTNAPSINIPNGVNMYAEVLTIVFNNPDSAKLTAIKNMSKTNLIAIVKLRNNTYRILGATNDGLIQSGGEGGSGTAATDRNGYSLQFSSINEDPANFVNSTLITSSLINFAS